MRAPRSTSRFTLRLALPCALLAGPAFAAPSDDAPTPLEVPVAADGWTGSRA